MHNEITVMLRRANNKVLMGITYSLELDCSTGPHIFCPSTSKYKLRIAPHLQLFASKFFRVAMLNNSIILQPLYYAV